MSDETTMPFDFSNGGTPSIIKVIGVGGGGGNAVNHMYREGIHDVTFSSYAIQITKHSGNPRFPSNSNWDGKD